MKRWSIWYRHADSYERLALWVWAHNRTQALRRFGAVTRGRYDIKYCEPTERLAKHGN